MIFLIEKQVNTKRIALLIEYKGDGLVGWQKQNNGSSVQGNIEAALFVLFKKNALSKPLGEQMLVFMHMVK